MVPKLSQPDDVDIATNLHQPSNLQNAFQHNLFSEEQASPYISKHNIVECTPFSTFHSHLTLETRLKDGSHWVCTHYQAIGNLL